MLRISAIVLAILAFVAGLALVVVVVLDSDSTRRSPFPLVEMAQDWLSDIGGSQTSGESGHQQPASTAQAVVVDMDPITPPPTSLPVSPPLLPVGSPKEINDCVHEMLSHSNQVSHYFYNEAWSRYGRASHLLRLDALSGNEQEIFDFHIPLSDPETDIFAIHPDYLSDQERFFVFFIIGMYVDMENFFDELYGEGLSRGGGKRWTGCDSYVDFYFTWSDSDDGQSWRLPNYGGTMDAVMLGLEYNRRWLISKGAN